MCKIYLDPDTLAFITLFTVIYVQIANFERLGTFLQKTEGLLTSLSDSNMVLKSLRDESA